MDDREAQEHQVLDDALTALEQAAAEERPAAVQAVLAAARPRIGSAEGLEELVRHAARFEAAGLFVGGPWEQASRLRPALVGGGLRAGGDSAVVEVLSELRMVAIAEGRLEHPEMSAAAARRFLREVVVLNLGLLFGGPTEEARERPEAHATAQTVVRYLIDHLSPSAVRSALLQEIDDQSDQRPILTGRIRDLIAYATHLPTPAEEDPEVTERLDAYRRAIQGASPRSAEHPEPHQYAQLLPELSLSALDEEIVAMAGALRDTGLTSPHHAMLVLHVATHHPDRLDEVLDLEPSGSAELDAHPEFVRELVTLTVHPELVGSISGLAGTLDRALLSRRAVAGSLRRLYSTDIHPVAKRNLMAKLDPRSGLSGNAVLLSGALRVLGKPLGVGQGNNPTCQSARGISIWSGHGPGYLLHALMSAARDDTLSMTFEGLAIESDKLAGGVADEIAPDLDPVSTVLVPHLDRIYDEMMRRAAGRGEDPHKWVNPGFYGRWVPLGFACALNPLTQHVTDYDAFVRRLYSTHHPAYNDGDDLIYPNPVGIFVTDVHGRLLGAHAVSLRRVANDDEGRLRAYFFNPNNEGRQDWGLGVVTSVRGHGEIPGESSLPFEQFAARLYAFHYHPFEGGPPEAVPDTIVDEVMQASKASWGQSYTWALPVGLRLA